MIHSHGPYSFEKNICSDYFYPKIPKNFKAYFFLVTQKNIGSI